MNPPENNDDRKLAIHEQWWPGLLCLVFWVLLGGWLIKSCAWGAEVKLAWNPNPEPDIAGYTLMVGVSPGQYTRTIPVGNITTATVDGLEEGGLYYISLKAINTAGVQSDPATAIAHLVIPASPELPRDGWQVSASSAETEREDNQAANAIDGDPQTLWHTTWGLTLAPHYFRIDLPRPALLSGLRYLPRQDTGTNGIVSSYQVETSADGETWQPVANGAWPADATEKYAALPLHSARYLRLWGQDPRMAAAEIRLHGSYEPEPVATARITLQQSTDLSAWTDMADHAVPLQPRQFFRLGMSVPGQSETDVIYQLVPITKP